MNNIFSLLFLLLTIFCSSAIVNACVCEIINDDPTSKEFELEINYEYFKATAVFIGEVIEIDQFTLKLKVQQSWKGVKTNEISMITGATVDKSNNSITYTSCDYHFIKGGIYLIYAFGTFKDLQTHACSRTRLIKYAENDLIYLNKHFKHKKFKIKRKIFSNYSFANKEQ